MGEFINFCPIISIEGSQMNRFDVPRMLEQLKRVYVERVVRNGFEDNSLYNDELMKLDDLELQEFDDLKKDYRPDQGYAQDQPGGHQQSGD